MIMNYIYHGLASYTRKSKKMKQVKIDVVKRTFAYWPTSVLFCFVHISATCISTNSDFSKNVTVTYSHSSGMHKHNIYLNLDSSHMSLWAVDEHGKVC